MNDKERKFVDSVTRELAEQVSEQMAPVIQNVGAVVTSVALVSAAIQILLQGNQPNDVATWLRQQADSIAPQSDVRRIH